MTFLGAVVGFPLLFTLICLGAGLLVDRASGAWMRGAAIPLVGLAGLIALGQLTTTLSVTAPLTGAGFAVVAATGFWLGRQRLGRISRRVTAEPWVVLVAGLVYLIGIAPILFAGRPSLAFYLTDTTSGTHLAGADWIIHHGRHYGGLSSNSSYGLQLKAYFEASNYPSGGHVLLAGIGQLLPIRLTWLYQPFMASVLASIAPAAYLLLRRTGASGLVVAFGAVLVSVPALVYALDLTGSIKELTALSLILLLGVITVDHKRWLRGPAWGAIPFGVATGAGISAIGVPFAAWALISGAILLVISFGALRRRVTSPVRLLAICGVAALVAAGSAPAVVGSYSKSAASANGIATTADPGNLLQPLNPRQALGVWVTGQYRFEPGEHVRLTYALIGIALLCVPLGAVILARRRNWVLLAWLTLLGLLWWRLTLKGTTWTDGKLILLSSPLVVLLVCSAPLGLWVMRQRLIAVLLGVAFGFGILYSDAVQYHETNLAPTARFDELAAINNEFSGKGPTLATDFDEYTFFELRNLEVSTPGFAYRTPTVATANVGYGQSVDIDAVPMSALFGQRLLVQRRGPAASRPPSNYALARRGKFYDVWQLRRSRRIVGRLTSSLPFSAQSVQKCTDIHRLALQARAAAGSLLVARRKPVRELIAGTVGHSLGWTGTETLTLGTPGRLDASVDIRRAGPFNIFLKGQIGRKLRVSVDGRVIGRVGEQTAGLQNFLTPLETHLSAGTHRLAVVRPGGSLRPGDNAPSTLDGIVVSPASNDSDVSTVAPENYESLCGQLTDWIEAIK